MNKKLIIVIAALAVVLVLLLVLILNQPTTSKDPQDTADASVPAASQDAPLLNDQPATQETNDTQSPTDNPDEPSSYVDTPIAPTTEETDRPQTEQTKPGEPNVSMGVVPGEETPDLDEDTPAGPGTTQQPTTGGNTGGSTEIPSLTTVTYETYIAMSGDQQQAFIDQFASVEEFVKWYNASKAKYEAEHPDIEIGGDTVIDGSQLLG